MDKDKLSQAIIALSELVERLRGPGGCPWDAQQTDLTLKMYLLEEAYEVLDAIEKGSPKEVCQELGDLLFQILFLCRLAEERGEFDLTEVIEGIREKMINRHPHVFGETDVESPEEVALNWARIKRNERDKVDDRSSVLQSVPRNLPALLRAHRINERASKVDRDGPKPGELWAKVEEEFKELRGTMLNSDKDRVGEKVGDLLFTLADLARVQGLNAEDLLRETNNRFSERFEES